MAKTCVVSAVALLSLSSSPTMAFKGEETRRRIGSYDIVTYDYSWKETSGHVLQIWRGNKKLAEHKASGGVWIFSLDRQEQSFEIKPTDKVDVRDLTGDGIKDLIVQEWSGGAHCCYTFDIYSLGPSLKHIWHHAAGNGHLHVALPPKGLLPKLEVENDREHIETGAPLSDMPLDIYQWRNGGFRLIRKKVPHHRAD